MRIIVYGNAISVDGNAGRWNTLPVMKNATYTVLNTNPGKEKHGVEICEDDRVEGFIETRKNYGFPIPSVIASGLSLDAAIEKSGYTREELGL